MIVVFQSFPLPPSVNQLYATGRHGKRYPTKALRDFKQSVIGWATIYRQDLKQARQYFHEIIYSDCSMMLHVDVLIHFRYSTFFTQDGKRKKIDAANRTKALYDSLGDILGIDDLYFSPGGAEPVIIPDTEIECTTIRMRTRRIRTLTEVPLQ